jgi:outer membrane biosynthesis protein TonB
MRTPTPARRSGRRRLLVVVSVGAHVAVVFGLFAAGIWKIEKVEAGRMPVDLAYFPQPEESGSEGASAPKVERFKPKKHEQKRIVEEMVQPTEVKKDVEEPTPEATDIGVGSGSGGGSGSGSGSGTGTGSGSGSGSGAGSGADSSSTCASPPCGELLVPPTVLKGLRISGETQVQPPAMTKIEIRHSGKTKLVAVFRVCVGTRGGVSTLRLVKSSGFPAYDSTLTAAVQDWKYKPYLLDTPDGKKPMPVCGMVTFIYAMQ